MISCDLNKRIPKALQTDGRTDTLLKIALMSQNLVPRGLPLQNWRSLEFSVWAVEGGGSKMLRYILFGGNLSRDDGFSAP